MYMVLAVGLFVAMPSAKATVLAPGASGLPDIINVPAFGSGSTLVAYRTGTFSDGTISGTYEEAVVSDTTNPYGSGDFDFEIAINPNTGTDAVGRVTETGYAGFSTDVGYDSLFCGIEFCGSSTLVAPTAVDRSLSGGTIGFTFASGALAPGDSSYILEIATNATSYTSSGTAHFIDGGDAAIADFAPSVPEPTTLSLMGMGLLSLLGLRKKSNA